MLPVNRRRFCGRLLAAGALSLMGLERSRNRLACADPLPGKGPLKDVPSPVAPRHNPLPRITDIEFHEVYIPYHDYNAKVLLRYHGLKFPLRTILIVKTDSGLEGYGELWGSAPAPETFSKYVGTSPFDWIAGGDQIGMDVALYDLMGKHLGLPAWKLLGPKVREWVPVAAWTVPQPPDAMAEEVRNVARRGFHWLKYHVDELQNVVDQTRAMDKAAPPGFKVLYDFNGTSNLEAVYPVLRDLERFAVAGRIEDPIKAEDRDGYRLLRQKCRLPILIHHGPDDFMIENLCDGRLFGHSPVGSAIKSSAIAEACGKPFMLQQIGGTINQAFLAHEAAVFKMATLDHVNGCSLWKDDVTVETMPVVGGSVKVLEKPGIGVTIDREKLSRYEKAPRPTQSRFLVRTRYASGLTLYLRHDADKPGATSALRALHPPHVPGPAPSYANPVVSDFWDEEGKPEFERMWKETESGPAWTEARA